MYLAWVYMGTLFVLCMCRADRRKRKCGHVDFSIDGSLVAVRQVVGRVNAILA